ncbi:MAG: hypothetical protein RL172_558 [Bacteroidota bacterium]|jgi:uncharacterized protein
MNTPIQSVKNLVIAGSEQCAITLDVFYPTGDAALPVIIYAHGFNGFKDWGNFDIIARRMAAAGFALIKFNFSHNGTTAENPTEFTNLEAFGNNNYSHQLTDLAIVTNWVCDSNNSYATVLNTQLIYLVGHSMGAGIAILYAASDPRIKKLVSWAGISKCKTPWGNWPPEKIKTWKETGVQYYTNSRTNQQMPLYYQLYIDYEKNHEKLDIKKAFAQLTIPLLLCHGAYDIAVPVEEAIALLEANPSAELFLVDSNHVFDRQHPWVVTWLPEAMEEVLGKTLMFLAEE